jgi:hypothetical protein
MVPQLDKLDSFNEARTDDSVTGNVVTLVDEKSPADLASAANNSCEERERIVGRVDSLEGGVGSTAGTDFCPNFEPAPNLLVDAAGAGVLAAAVPAFFRVRSGSSARAFDSEGASFSEPLRRTRRSTD